jgi:hypothetical protein
MTEPKTQTEQEANHDAYVKYLEFSAIQGLEPSARLKVFEEVWDCATNFALSVSGWTAINGEDDLPKVEGKYLVTQIYRISPHEVETSRYKPDDPFYRQNWLNNYSAWCECPAPYEPQENQR